MAPKRSQSVAEPGLHKWFGKANDDAAETALDQEASQDNDTIAASMSEILAEHMDESGLLAQKSEEEAAAGNDLFEGAPVDSKCAHDGCRGAPEGDEDAMDCGQELGIVSGLGASFADVKPLCGKCGNEVDPFRAQIKSKSSAGNVRWQCNTCNSKTVSLSRSFGRWPLPEFQELSKDDQMHFWREIAVPGVGLQKMKSLLVERVVRARTDKVEASISGSWLPLSVYQAQGYDVERIVANCTGANVKENPILGTVYRVPISTLCRSTAEARVRESLLKSWSDVTRPARASVVSAPAQVSAPTPDAIAEEDISRMC